MTPDMPRLSTVCGAALIVLGAAMYAVSGQASLTALIPVPFGVVLVVLGAVSARLASPKHPMHAAAAVALLGILGSIGGVPDTVRLLLGSEIENPLAAVAKTVMAADLTVFLAFAIQSFRQARRARE